MSKTISKKFLMRIILVIAVAGIAIFGAFTGYVASWFLAPTEKRQATEMQEIQSELEALRKAVEELGGKRG